MPPTSGAGPVVETSAPVGETGIGKTRLKGLWMPRTIIPHKHHVKHAGKLYLIGVVGLQQANGNIVYVGQIFKVPKYHLDGNPNVFQATADGYPDPKSAFIGAQWTINEQDGLGKCMRQSADFHN
jgi:hypothetical protein